jgi:N utilization substance protein B
MLRGPRRQGREAALQVLYAADVASELDPEGIDRAYRRVTEQFSLPARARERAWALARGVVVNLSAIDRHIAGACMRWKLERLATVDRNVLRIATYELLFEPQTPAEVVINEALEIARRFGSEKSPSFVNGVLDVIARERATARP